PASRPWSSATKSTMLRAAEAAPPAPCVAAGPAVPRSGTSIAGRHHFDSLCILDAFLVGDSPRILRVARRGGRRDARPLSSATRLFPVTTYTTHERHHPSHPAPDRRGGA